MTRAAASAATTRADITPNRHPYRGEIGRAHV